MDGVGVFLEQMGGLQPRRVAMGLLSRIVDLLQRISHSRISQRLVSNASCFGGGDAGFVLAHYGHTVSIQSTSYRVRGGGTVYLLAPLYSIVSTCSTAAVHGSDLESCNPHTVPLHHRLHKCAAADLSYDDPGR